MLLGVPAQRMLNVWGLPAASAKVKMPVVAL